MGEMADWLTESYAGSDDYEDWYDTSPRYKKICMHCGEGNLDWTQTGTGWRLMNEKAEIHSCDKFKEKTK